MGWWRLVPICRYLYIIKSGMPGQDAGLGAVIIDLVSNLKKVQLGESSKAEVLIVSTRRRRNDTVIVL